MLTRNYKITQAEKSICPIVNWKDSPGYKLAKYLNTILNATLQLPNAFNMHNNSTLAHSLKQVHRIMFVRHREYVHEHPSTGGEKHSKNIIENNNNTSKEAKKKF
jgi:hypothetical protein